MSEFRKLVIAIGAALVLVSGANAQEAVGAAAEAEAEMAPMLPELIVTSIPFEADALPAGLIGRAFATLSLRDGVMWFSAVGAGYNPPPGQVLAAGAAAPPVLRNIGGDIDLTGFPPGNVQITVGIDDSVYSGGYRIPADPWQAVALAADPPGAPEAPAPVFGQGNWPANFEAPSVSADQRSVTWIDTESDQNVYEYSLALDGPNGRIILDPKIKPGGSTNR